MEFQFSPQQELLRKSVREFAEGAIAAKVAHMEETDEVPWDLYKEMGRQQYMGILTPKEFGGSAMGHLCPDDHAGGDRGGCLRPMRWPCRSFI